MFSPTRDLKPRIHSLCSEMKILVAPVLEKGAEERTIRLPNGRWREGGGNIIDGGRSITVKVGISDIPHFFRI